MQSVEILTNAYFKINHKINLSDLLIQDLGSD